MLLANFTWGRLSFLMIITEEYFRRLMLARKFQKYIFIDTKYRKGLVYARIHSVKDVGMIRNRPQSPYHRHQSLPHQSPRHSRHHHSLQSHLVEDDFDEGEVRK